MESERPKEGIMDYEEIARQANEMADAGDRAHKEDAQRLVETLNISPELARYLLTLEVRIRELEDI